MKLSKGKTYTYTGGTKPAKVEYCEKSGQFFCSGIRTRLSFLI